MFLTLVAGGISAGLGLFALVQWLVVWNYLRFMRPTLIDADSPITTDDCAVVIALRGADPGLLSNLTRHLQQEGVKHHVHFVVDSLDDPVVRLLEELPPELRDRWTLQVLKLESDTASLKCLGLAQVVRERLNSASPPAYFAFADGDGQVSYDWLRRLLEPLRTDAAANHNKLPIGATTGHRWYTCFPPSTADDQANDTSSSWGGMVRYFWNLGSLPQMHLYQVVWGGSWAVRREVLEQGGLLGSWDKALFEDTQVASWVRSAGYRVVTAPGLLVSSYESVRVTAATRWIARQLLDMRLYHSHFHWTAGHAALSAALSVLAWAVVVIGSSVGRWDVVASVLSAWVVYQFIYLLIWWRLQRMADRCLAALRLAASPVGSHGWTINRVARASVGMLLTQVCYPLATLAACRMRHVTWRGIGYRIFGRDRIQRLNYHVYGSASSSNPTQESL
jgi:hypothetical protein